ncbi:GNAT family N-acetyltransferase [Endozoicomonas sp. 2B-B]
MIHGMIDSASVQNKPKISISPTLKEASAFMGFKVKVICNCSDLPYLPMYFSSLKEITPIDPIEEMKEEFEKLSNTRLSDRACNLVIIELLDSQTSNLIAFISMQDNKKSLFVKMLATQDEYKGRGAGQFLMRCAIDVAIKRNITTVKLNPEGSARQFYIKKIGMIETNNSELEYSHPRYNDIKTHFSPVLSKFKLIQTEEKGYFHVSSF